MQCCSLMSYNLTIHTWSGERSMIRCREKIFVVDSPQYIELQETEQGGTHGITQGSGLPSYCGFSGGSWWCIGAVVCYQRPAPRIFPAERCQMRPAMHPHNVVPSRLGPAIITSYGLKGRSIMRFLLLARTKRCPCPRRPSHPIFALPI
jgi:hypothetical protein